MKKFIILALAAIISLGANAQQASKGEQTVTIQTNGVCQKCADKFKENVPYFKGVKSYTYDMKTAKLTINYDSKKTNPDQLRQQISKLGYNADNVKADQAARAKLPACCRAEKNSGGCGGCAGHGNGQGCGNHQNGAKSCGNQGAEHKCSGQQGAEHKCSGHADGKSCQGHANGHCSNHGEAKSCNDHNATKQDDAAKKVSSSK